MQGKKAIIRSPSCPPPNVVKQGWLAIVGILNRLEEVIRVIGLAKVILYVIVLRRNAKFDKFILECSRLLKEAMDLPFDFHIYSFIDFLKLLRLVPQDPLIAV